MLAIVLLLSVVVGISLGLLGGGGSILTVPILVYVAGMDAKVAIATSLLVVGVTSAAGAVSHARAGRVQWRTGLVFGAAGMAGAFLGGRLGSMIDGTILLVVFALMMAATAVAMLRGRREHEPAGGEMAVWKVIVDGVVVGVVTGLVGAGGGFLVVPALVLLGGVPISVAVGTSLVVIAMKSMAGLAGYLSSISIDWPLALGVTAAAVVGSVIGGRLVDRIPQQRLRRGFGWFVAVMSVFVLVQEAPADLGATVLGSPVAWAIAGLAALLAAAAVLRARRRRHGREDLDRAGDDPAAIPSHDPAPTGTGSEEPAPRGAGSEREG